MKSEEIFDKNWLLILILFLFSVIMFFHNIDGGRRELWAPDESKYAEVAREMILSGDYLVPHVNGEIYAHKPPLFFWLVAIFSLLLGKVDVLSAALPSALAALGCVVTTYQIGRLLFNPKAGFLAGMILATAGKFIWQGRFGQIDMLLTFLITLSIFLFLKWFYSDRNSSTVLYFSYVLMGLATLAKGPVGFLIPILIIVIYLALTGNIKIVKKSKPLLGILIVLAVVLAWLVPAAIAGGEEYSYALLFRQTLTRYFEPWHHHQPFYYFLKTMPLDFLPWSVFLPTGIFAAYIAFRKDKNHDVLFPLVWFLLVLTFFSVSKGKRSVYMVPLFPAGALLVGWLWDGFLANPNLKFVRKKVTVPYYIVIGLFFSLAILLPIIVSSVEIYGESISRWMHLTYPISFIMGMGVLLSFILFIRKTYLFSLMAICIMLAAFTVYSSGLIVPVINSYKSDLHFCEAVNSIVDEQAPLGYYSHYDASFNLYTKRILEKIEEPEQLDEFFNSEQTVFLMIEEKTLNNISSKLNIQPRIVYRADKAYNRMLLISNQRDSPTDSE